MSAHVDLSTYLSAASAVAAIGAAFASIWSAKAARDAVAQAARQARAALVHDLSQSVTTVTSRAERVGTLVARLKLARESGFALAGCNVRAAGGLIRADEVRGAEAAAMMREARAQEMRHFGECTDEEMQALTRKLESYSARLEIMERDLEGELERIEADNRDARARALRAADSRR